VCLRPGGAGLGCAGTHMVLALGVCCWVGGLTVVWGASRKRWGVISIGWDCLCTAWGVFEVQSSGKPCVCLRLVVA